MNGISFMQVLQTQPVTQVSLNEASVSANDKASFFQMLNDSIAWKKLDGSHLLKESENKELLGELFAGNKLEFPAFLKENELEEHAALLKLLSQLVDVLSNSDALLTKDVLTNPLVEDLVEQLPIEVQIELQDFFEGDGSLKSLIEQGEVYLDDPIELLAVVIGLAHFQSQHQDNPKTETESHFHTQGHIGSELVGKMTDQVAEKLLVQLEKHLPMLFQEKPGELQNIIKDLEKQVTETLALLSSKQNNSPLNNKQSNLELFQLNSQLKSEVEKLEKNHIQPSSVTTSIQDQVKEINKLESPIKMINLEKLLQQITANLQSMTTKDKQMLLEGFQNSKKGILNQPIDLSLLSRVKPEQVANMSQGISHPIGHGLQMQPTQQFVIHLGESRGNQPTNEQFLRQFQNILGRSSLTQFPNGVNQLSIKLYPEHLGRLDVKLTLQNGVIVAQLMTATNAAKSTIESQLHQLKQAFVAQNIQVDKIEVSTQQQQQSLGQSDKENQEEKNHNKPKQEQQNLEDVDEEVKFEDFFKESFNTKV